MLGLSNDGIVLIAGTYQLVSLKTFFFYVVAGCASVLSYLITTKEKKTFRGIFNHLGIGAFVALIISGAMSDIFNKELTALWIAAFLGFFSNQILKKLIQNTDQVVDSIFSKYLSFLDKDKKGGKDDTKPSN